MKALEENEILIIVEEYVTNKYSTSELALIHHVADQTIYNYLSEHGVVRRRSFKEVDRDTFIKDWNIGMSSKCIAKIFNLKSIPIVNAYVRHYREAGYTLLKRRRRKI